MCCVAIARRKYLRCNISTFPKYEVGSCITGQRSEKQNALAGTNHMCPCATEDVLFLPLPLCPRLKEAEPQEKTGPKPYATHVDALKNDDFRLIHTLRFREF